MSYRLINPSSLDALSQSSINYSSSTLESSIIPFNLNSFSRQEKTIFFLIYIFLLTFLSGNKNPYLLRQTMMHSNDTVWHTVHHIHNLTIEYILLCVVEIPGFGRLEQKWVKRNNYSCKRNFEYTVRDHIVNKRKNL